MTLSFWLFLGHIRRPCASYQTRPRLSGEHLLTSFVSITV